jgi:hypothetical protein
LIECRQVPIVDVSIGRYYAAVVVTARPGDAMEEARAELLDRLQASRPERRRSAWQPNASRVRPW